MKYYLIAGEASGDLHGANLIKALKKEDPQAEFRFCGGDLMAAETGSVPMKHYADTAFMGFAEVLINLRSIFRNIREVKADISSYHPDAVVLIDYPGFNLRIAEFAKKQGYRVLYYISPKVWAWNQKRVLKIKAIVDRMFCILPFEVDFYRQWGMEVDYVGNPLLDAIAAHEPDKLFKLNNNLNVKPVIALLPGSREQEITAILPVMLQVADRFPNYQFVIARVNTFDFDFYEEMVGDRDVRVSFGSTYDLLLNSQAALVTSGTATLETALLRVPQVVLYKGNALSVAIARMLVKIRFISLVNLIIDDEIVKELIQGDCTPERISDELDNILHDPLERTSMLIGYDDLAERMGKPGASEKTAKLILEDLRSSK